MVDARKLDLTRAINPRATARESAGRTSSSPARYRTSVGTVTADSNGRTSSFSYLRPIVRIAPGLAPDRSIRTHHSRTSGSCAALGAQSSMLTGSPQCSIIRPQNSRVTSTGMPSG
jgi:hypothetical protein